MANLLLESSAFTKYFQPEAGSDRVISLVDDPSNQTFVSWLTWDAISLLLRHGQNLPLRTLDALQLAVALDLKAQGLLDFFVCADETLCQVAEKEGITVVNPAKTCRYKNSALPKQATDRLVGFESVQVQQVQKIMQCLCSEAC
jgi:hypothetical protein